ASATMSVSAWVGSRRRRSHISRPSLVATAATSPSTSPAADWAVAIAEFIGVPKSSPTLATRPCGRTSPICRQPWKARMWSRHMCWGSGKGPHTNDLALKEFVDIVLSVNAGAYSIEAANPRHEWEWQVWESTRLPEGKVLIPGVIAHCTDHVEHPRLVAQRLVRY